MVPPKSGAWDQLREESNASPHSTAEVQLLWELRQALRRRTVHVPSRLSSKSRAKMLTIEKGWDAHLKVADAVMSGRLSATEAIEMRG